MLRRQQNACAAAILVCFACVCTTSGDAVTNDFSWRTVYGDPQNSYRKAAASIVTDQELATQRVVSQLPVLASPVLSRRWQLLYVPTLEGKGKIVAFESSCQLTTVWTTILDFPVTISPALDDKEDILYVATVGTSPSKQGTALYGLNASTGAIIFQWKPAPPSSNDVKPLISSDLKVSGENVFFALSGSAQWLVALHVPATSGNLSTEANTPEISWSCVTDAAIRQPVAVSKLKNVTLRNSQIVSASWIFFVAESGDAYGIFDLASPLDGSCAQAGAGPVLSGTQCGSCADWTSQPAGTMLGSIIGPIVVAEAVARDSTMSVLLLATSAQYAGVSGAIYALDFPALLEWNVSDPKGTQFREVFSLPTFEVSTTPLLVASCEDPLLVVGSTAGTLLALNMSTWNATSLSHAKPAWWESLGFGTMITAGPTSDGTKIVIGTAATSVVMLSLQGQILASNNLGEGLASSGSISWLLFNNEGSLFSTTGSATGLVTVQDGRCPPSTRRIMYVLVTSLGSTTLTVTMLYYCFVAHKQRVQQREEVATCASSQDSVRQSSSLQPPPLRGSTQLRRRALGVQDAGKSSQGADISRSTSQHARTPSLSAKLRDMLRMVPSRTYAGLGDHADNHTHVNDLDTVIDHLSPSHMISPTAYHDGAVGPTGSIN